jgi:HEAT repeat protein
MADKKVSNLPLEFDDESGRELWDALGEIDREQPSSRLRRSFHEKLEHASRGSWLDRLRASLGLRSNAGWLTATACVLVGLGVGHLSSNVNDSDGERLAALEQNVTALNRRLILDRLEDQAPGTRLRGVMDAASYAGDDAEIANALLVRATQDRVSSVRSAAIDALGASTSASAVGEQVMGLLEKAESPIVQLALVDLVLRYGNEEQIDQLLTLAGQDRLHPDLARHVIASVQGDTA